MTRGTAHAQSPSVWRGQCAGWDGGEGGSEPSHLEDPGRCLIPHASHEPAVLYKDLAGAAGYRHYFRMCFINVEI